MQIGSLNQQAVDEFRYRKCFTALVQTANGISPNDSCQPTTCLVSIDFSDKRYRALRQENITSRLVPAISVPSWLRSPERGFPLASNLFAARSGICHDFEKNSPTFRETHTTRITKRIRTILSVSCVRFGVPRHTSARRLDF
mgnify:CR=1 FL=1